MLCIVHWLISILKFYENYYVNNSIYTEFLYKDPYFYEIFKFFERRNQFVLLKISL